MAAITAFDSLGGSLGARIYIRPASSLRLTPFFIQNTGDSQIAYGREFDELSRS